jgi:hypothetical protein
VQKPTSRFQIKRAKLLQRNSVPLKYVTTTTGKAAYRLAIGARVKIKINKT